MGASVGGLLADSVGWRWGYLGVVPVAVVSVLIFLLRARPKLALVQASVKSSQDMDVLGSSLLVRCSPLRS